MTIKSLLPIFLLANRIQISFAQILSSNNIQIFVFVLTQLLSYIETMLGGFYHGFKFNKEERDGFSLQSQQLGLSIKPGDLLNPAN